MGGVTVSLMGYLLSFYSLEYLALGKAAHRVAVIKPYKLVRSLRKAAFLSPFLLFVSALSISALTL